MDWAGSAVLAVSVIVVAVAAVLGVSLAVVAMTVVVLAQRLRLGGCPGASGPLC